MVENKEPVAYNDPRRVNKMLDIVCNMYKCKYDILKNETLKGDHIQDTAIIINVGSLIADWVDYSGKNASFERVEAEEIVPKILEVAGHYRRFYQQYGQCRRTWVFLIGLSNMDMYRMKEHPDFPDTNWFDKDLSPEDYGKFNYIIIKALEDIFDICRYIPGIYYVNTCMQDDYINSGMVIFNIVNQMMYYTNKGKSGKRRILVVSGNELDFSCLGENTPNFDYQMYGFKRRHQTIFTYENIFAKLIFGNRKKRLILPTARFSKIYSIVLAAVMHRVTAFKMLEHTLEGNNRPKVLFELFKDLKDWNSEKELNDFIRRCEKVIHENPKYGKCYDCVLDIVSATAKKVEKIQFDVHRWKVDMVDYQIEQINDFEFQKYKINFHDLM